MKEPPNGDSQFHISPIVEVIERPSDHARLDFKISLSPLMEVQVGINVAALHEAIRLKAWLSLNEVFDGKPLKDWPFSKARIGANSRWAGTSDPKLTSLFERAVWDVSKREIVLMLERMMALPGEALLESLVLTVLDLDEDEVFSIAAGDRRKILKAYAKSIERKIFDEMKRGRPVRGRVWTRGKGAMALEMHDVTLNRLESLKKARRKLFPVGEPRRKEGVARWQQLKAENADLADVLDQLENTTAGDLAVTHVCNLLGRDAFEQVRKQIKIARRRKKGLCKNGTLSPLEARVNELVDAVVAKK